MAEFKLGRLKFVWKGVWTANTAYVKDDIIKYGGTSFTCVTGHTANADFNVDLTAGKWQKMTTGLEWKSAPWNISTLYKEGDIVRYGGKTYVSVANHTSNGILNGGFYTDLAASKWNLLIDGTESKGNWSTGTYYKLGDLVKYNSSTYVCNTPHTSAATTALGLEANFSNWTLQTEGFKWRAAWDVATRYIVNDVVKYGPNLWICTTAHTSGGAFVDTNWALFVSGLEFEDGWSSTDEYQQGDIVTYGGYVYTAVAQHTNKVPPLEPAFWELVTTGYSNQGRYNSGLSYQVGDVVNYGGQAFVANVEVAAEESPYATPAKWSLVSDGIRWLGEWSDTLADETYKYGDAIKYGQSSYICIQEHTPANTIGAGSNRPDQDLNGDFWQTLAEGDEANVLRRRGDILTRDSIQNKRLPLGPEGTFLKAGETDVEWGKVGVITRVFYVSTDGIDEPGRGTTLNDPWRTIKYACDYVRTVVVPTVSQPAVINIKTGVYQEVFPISVPKFTSLVGDELRMSIIEPTPETSGNDKFYLRDSTTLRNFTFRGATGANLPNGLTSTYTAENQYGTMRPTGGAWVGLDPGAGPNDESVWVGARSPYIQNVTTFGDYCVGQKIDGALHNGGNKSITSNDFTQLLSNGIGAWCLNQGRAELVSVFTYYAYIGYLCEAGGVIRATNGNNSYGTYGSVSEGVDPTEVSRTAEVDNRRLDAIIDNVQTNGDSILYVEYLNAGETYTDAAFSFAGGGSANIVAIPTIQNGGVAEVRSLDDGDGYLGVTNNAQQGDTKTIRISNSDTTISSGYDGMRITLVDGAGAGQYGIVNKYDGGAKDVYVLKESFTPVEVTATEAGSNIITVANNTTLSLEDPVMFLGTPSFGGLNPASIYYVIELVSTTGIKVSTEIGGAELALSNGSGSLKVHKMGWDVFSKPRTVSIENISATNPVRVTTTSNHGLSTGFVATLTGATGADEVLGVTYYVGYVSPTEFDLYTNFTLLVGVDGTALTPYVSGGEAYGRQEPRPFLDTTTRYAIEPRPVFSTGSGASATAVRTLGIDTVTPVNLGSGYTTPPEILLASPDTVVGNVNATANVSINGQVSEILIQSRGTNYLTPPTLTFVGGGLPASYHTWTASIDAILSDYVINSTKDIYEVTVAGVYGSTEPTHTTGTASNGTATLSYVGTLATATAEVARTIKTVVLNDGGVGYTTPPTVIVTGDDGSGAVISAQISQVIGSVDIDLAGSSYTSTPEVSFIGGEPIAFAEARAVLSASVTEIEMIEGGEGYNPNTTTIVITGGGLPNGSANHATAEVVVDFGGWQQGVTPGVITGINVLTNGTGYATPPIINIISSSGIGAVARANIEGVVDRIEVTNRGRGYQTVPLVQINGGGGTGATATAIKTGSIKSLTVIDGGAGWTGIPEISFSGGGGSNASATVTEMDFVISNVIINDGGANYTSNPALAINSDTGRSAILRPRIDGQVSEITVVDPGSDYSDVTPTLVSFIGGGNYRSPQTGLKYYANASSRVAIGAQQVVETLASIAKIKTLAKSIVNDADPEDFFQTYVPRVPAAPEYTTPDGISNAIDSWVDSIYYTIQNGESSTNSAELLRLNRRFIKKQLELFLDSTFSGTADATWYRDIGLIVDAVANDIGTKGVNYSVSCGTSQAFLAARGNSENFGSIGAITNAFITIKSLMLDVVQNIVVVPLLDAGLSWKGVWGANVEYAVDDIVIANGGTYKCLEAHTSATVFTTDLDLNRWVVEIDGQATNNSVFEPVSLTAISNNINLIENLTRYAGGSATFTDAANLILENRKFIQAEVIAFVNSSYLDFDYNQALCARDTGFIVDALAKDLQSANGVAEPTATVTTTGVVSSITVDNGGEGYSAGVTIGIVGGGTPSVNAVAVPVINVYTGAITSFTMTNKGKGYSTDPIDVTITPDTGSGAIARCRLAGSNVSRIVIVEPGSGYSAGPFIRLIDPNNTEDALFDVRVANGVLGQPVITNRGTGWLNATATVTGDGYADIRQTGSFVYVKSLTNVPTPGANIQFEGNPEYYKLVNVREIFGPDGIIGGRNILLANKQFIQYEIISYLSNFAYDSAVCSRDVGFLIDAIGEDLVLGTNSNLLYTIHQYRRGIYSQFENQKFQTAFAYDYLRQQISQSQKPATLSALAELKSQIATALVGKPSAIANANASMDIVYSILNNGLTSVPAIVNPDPTTIAEGTVNARTQLLTNAEFIKAEMIQYITNNHVGLVYDEAVCRRDIGYIIDALRYDLTYGGNLMTVLAGLAYYSYNELQIGQTEKTPFIDSLEYIRTIIDEVVQGIAVAAPLQTTVLQAGVGGALGSPESAGFLQNRISELKSVINTGSSPAVIEPETAWAADELENGKLALVAAKEDIQASIITFIEENYPTLVFNRATCSRDIGLIIDAIGWDLTFGSNFQSIKAGMAYYRANAAAVLANGNATINQSLESLVEWIKNGERNYSIPAPVMPNGNGTADDSIGKDNILANIEFFGYNSYLKFVNDNPSLVNDIDATVFRKDLEQIALVVAHDLTYSGNAKTVKFANSFFTGTPSAFVLAGYLGEDANTIKPQYLTFVDYLNTTLQAIVSNSIVSEEVGLPVTVNQDRSGTPAGSGAVTRVSNLINNFKSIINLVSVPTVENSTSGYLGTLLSAQTALQNSKTPLTTAVTNWMTEQFVNFTYDTEICFRDVGLIVQAIADDVFGDVAKSIEAGQRYYAATAALVLSDQKPQTIAAIDRINIIAQKVIRNETYTRTQNFAFQERYPLITGGGEAGPALEDRVYIIRTILEHGDRINQVKDLLLANKKFIQDEVIAYINASYENLDYDQVLCARDVGLIIDALSYDIFGGFSRSREAGLRYYSSASALKAITGDQEGPTKAGIERIRDIALSVIRDEDPSVTFQEIEDRQRPLVYDKATCARDVGLIIEALAYDLAFGGNFRTITAGRSYYRAGASVVTTQQKAATLASFRYLKELAIDAVAGNGTAVASVSTNMDTILNILENGLGVVPGYIYPDPTGYDVGFKNARDLIDANKAFIKAEVTAWLEYNYVNFDSNYNSLTCARDIGLIIDAISYDLVTGSNFASSVAGQAYYRQQSDVVINNQLLQTLGAVNFAKTSALTQVDSTLQSVVASAFDNVLNILENGMLAVPAYSFTGNGASSEDEIASAATLQTNKATYKTAIATYLETNYAQLWVTLTEDQKALCQRDVGYIVDAVTYDVLYGGNYQSVIAGEAYYSFGTLQIAAGETEATLDAYGQLKTLLAADVEATVVTTVEGLVDDIISIIDTGDSPIVTYPNLVGSTTLQSSFTALQAARASIQSNTTQYITDTFSSLEYDVATCERDIEYILDSLYYDLTYGGNLETTIAGKAYYSFGTLQIDTNDKQATLGAYGKLKELIGKIAQNQDVSQLQSLEEQVTGPAGSSGAATAAQNLIQNIIGIIDTQTIPTPVYPARTWGDPALAAKSIFLQNLSETIKASVTQYVDDNWAYSVTEVEKLLVADKLVDSTAELISVINGGPSSLPAGLYRARLQISPPLTAFNTPTHVTPTTIRSKYSQVRLTGHDFLNIGTGNKNDTNYPGIPVNVPEQANEIVEVGGGRCFYTSTDQDGNFRVGELFRVEQSTGIATLNADAFNLSGLNELSLGGITLGGTNATIREFSTDATFFANSDNIVPTQKAIKTYIQSALGSGGGNISVNAVIAGQAFLSGDELTTIGNIPMRFTSTGGYQVLSGIESTSPSTGSLIVQGGVGIDGNLNVSGTATANFGTLIAGGIQNTPIGSTTRNSGAFTTLTANSVTSLTATTQSEDTTTGALVVTGGVGIAGNVNVGGNLNVSSLTAESIDNTPVGGTVRSTGAFTTLAANDTVSLTKNDSSTSTSTGTLRVTGGVGISENLYVGGNIVLTGNFTVNGTTTTVNSTTIAVDDKNIELGAVDAATDATANGGGITLKGATDKTIVWDSANTNWTSSEHWNIATGKTFKINNTTVLSATQVLGKTLGGTTAGDIATIDATQTLTNKTLTLPTIGGTGATFNGSSSGTTVFKAAAAAGTTTITMPGTTGTMALAGDTHYIGTTAVTLNRASANLALTGISSVQIPGSTSGTITVQAAATAGTNTITLPATTGTVSIVGDSFYIGTSQIANNRGSGTLSLTGVNIDGSSGSCSGNAATATTATTATTANGLNTSNSYQVNSLGVGTAASGTGGEIRATNNITAFFTSDRKFKENVRDIPNALDKVVAIGGKLFAWSDAYIEEHGGADGYFVQKEDFGVIAQDVLAAFPRATRTKPDGTLVVDYEKLSALAFAAIIELKKEVDSLKEQLKK